MTGISGTSATETWRHCHACECLTPHDGTTTFWLCDWCGFDIDEGDA